MITTMAVHSSTGSVEIPTPYPMTPEQLREWGRAAYGDLVEIVRGTDDQVIGWRYVRIVPGNERRLTTLYIAKERP